jgi:hypothetical protein
MVRPVASKDAGLGWLTEKMNMSATKEKQKVTTQSESDIEIHHPFFNGKPPECRQLPEWKTCLEAARRHLHATKTLAELDQRIAGARPKALRVDESAREFLDSGSLDGVDTGSIPAYQSEFRQLNEQRLIVEKAVVLANDDLNQAKRKLAWAFVNSKMPEYRALVVEHGRLLLELQRKATELQNFRTSPRSIDSDVTFLPCGIVYPLISQAIGDGPGLVEAAIQEMIALGVTASQIGGELPSMGVKSWAWNNN